MSGRHEIADAQIAGQKAQPRRQSAARSAVPPKVMENLSAYKRRAKFTRKADDEAMRSDINSKSDNNVY